MSDTTTVRTICIRHRRRRRISFKIKLVTDSTKIITILLSKRRKICNGRPKNVCFRNMSAGQENADAFQIVLIQDHIYKLI